MSFVESSVREHVFPSIKKMTTNGTGNCAAVGFLVAFLIIGTAEFFSTVFVYILMKAPLGLINET
jgi:hypothetical protein